MNVVHVILDADGKIECLFEDISDAWRYTSTGGKVVETWTATPKGNRPLTIELQEDPYLESH